MRKYPTVLDGTPPYIRDDPYEPLVLKLAQVRNQCVDVRTRALLSLKAGHWPKKMEDWSREFENLILAIDKLSVLLDRVHQEQLILVRIDHMKPDPFLDSKHFEANRDIRIRSSKAAEFVTVQTLELQRIFDSISNSLVYIFGVAFYDCDIEGKKLAAGKSHELYSDPAPWLACLNPLSAETLTPGVMRGSTNQYVVVSGFNTSVIFKGNGNNRYSRAQLERIHRVVFPQCNTFFDSARYIVVEQGKSAGSHRRDSLLKLGEFFGVASGGIYEIVELIIAACDYSITEVEKFF